MAGSDDGDDFSDAALPGLPLRSFLTYELLRVTNLLNRQAAAILREGGLKLPEWRCMAFIAEQGGLSPRGIHALTDMDPGLITRTLQGLVERGLVTMENDKADRRVVIATLTPTGRAIHDRLRPIMHARQVRLLQAIPEADRDTLMSALRAIRQSVVE